MNRVIDADLSLCNMFFTRSTRNISGNSTRRRESIGGKAPQTPFLKVDIEQDPAVKTQKSNRSKKMLIMKPATDSPFRFNPDEEACNLMPMPSFQYFKKHARSVLNMSQHRRWIKRNWVSAPDAEKVELLRAYMHYLEDLKAKHRTGDPTCVDCADLFDRYRVETITELKKYRDLLEMTR